MIIFLSLKCFIVFFLHGIIDWILENISARNLGVQMDKRVGTEWGVVVSVNVQRMRGKKDQILAILVCAYSLNDPLRDDILRI